MSRFYGLSDTTAVLVIILFTLFLVAAALPADVMVDPYQTGATDVNPGDPANWKANRTGIVGEDFQGELLINGGSSLQSGYLYIGENTDSIGILTIDGANSSLFCRHEFVAGDYGRGTLSITNGGVLDSDGNGYIAVNPGSEGHVTVSGAQSQWDNKKKLYAGNYGQAALTISDGGTVTNADSYVGNELGSSCTVTVSDSGSTWDHDALYLGYSGQGVLNIYNGAAVYSDSGVAAANAGAYGVVLVDGANSLWSVSGQLSVGDRGDGQLSLVDGGKVNSATGVIGRQSGAVGEVIVAGAGSQWIVEGNLLLGDQGRGTLNIFSGGQVTVGTWASLNINSQSLLNIEVSGNDILTIGQNLTNDGTVQLAAQAKLAAGTYTPISIGGSWQGGGVYQTFGGVWDDVNHQLLVAAAETVAAGEQVTIDLLTQQRVDVGDNLCLNFMPTTVSTLLSITAGVTADPIRSDLESVLPEGEGIQDSYDFTVDGLPTGDSVMVSFAVAENLTRDDLTVWHYDSVWTQYTPDDLVISDGWASFTMDSFSSYAVTAVPEPASAGLLLLGVGVLLKKRKRKK